MDGLRYAQKSDNDLHIVMEFVNGGNLFQFIQKN